MARKDANDKQQAQRAASRRQGYGHGTGATAPPPPPPPPLSSSDDDEPDEGEEDADAEALRAPPERDSMWALKGSLAGRVAADCSRRGQEYSVDPPPSVVDAGTAAEHAWLRAFADTFKPAPRDGGASPAEEDDRRLVSGLAVAKRRRLSGAKPVLNKAGRAGLDESAEAVVSTFTYAWVRLEFFLPSDHLCVLLRNELKAEGFEHTEAEFEAWWEEKGHTLALTKAKSARASIVIDVKAGIWLAHGAAAHALFIARTSRPEPAHQWARRSPLRRRPSTPPVRSASAMTRHKPQAPLLLLSCKRGAQRPRTSTHHGAKQVVAAAVSLASRGGWKR